MSRPTDDENDRECRWEAVDAAKRQATALERIAAALEKIVDWQETRPKAGWTEASIVPGAGKGNRG